MSAWPDYASMTTDELETRHAQLAAQIDDLQRQERHISTLIAARTPRPLTEVLAPELET